MAVVNKGWAFVSGSGDYNAGGSNTQIQFNNAGVLDGTADLTWDGSKVHTTNLSASSNISASAFYGDGSNITNVTASAVSVADGPEMSLQFRYDSPIGKEISGSANLMWITASTDYLQVTGAVKVAGSISASTSISASEYYIQSGNSIYFGTGNDTKITRNGTNLDINGTNIVLNAGTDVSASSNLSASAFYGDGANLTNVTASAVSVADGPEMSLQFRYDSPIGKEISGSAALMWITSSTPPFLQVTGSLKNEGYLYTGKNGTAYIINNADPNTYIRLGGAVPPGVDGMAFGCGGKEMLMLDNNATVDTVILGAVPSDVVYSSGSLTASVGARILGDLSVCAGTASIAHLSGCSPIQVHAPISSSYNISASSFYGDFYGASLINNSGHLTIQNEAANKRIINKLGSADSNTSFQIRASDNTAHFAVDGAGTVVVTPTGILQISSAGVLSSSANLSASAFYGDFYGNSLINNSGHLTIQNTDAGKKIINQLGSNDSNTSFQIRNSDGNASLAVDGAGTVVVTPTGILQISSAGVLSSSANLSASAFYGDFSNLTNLPSAGGGGIFTELSPKEAATTSSVSVGHSASPSATLHVSSSQDQELAIVACADAGTILFITGAAGVGINTKSPSVSLDVHYSGNLNPINLADNTGGGEIVYFGSGSGPLVTGGLYYLNADGGWQSANAANTGSGHNQLMGIAMGNKVSKFGVLIKGYFDVTYFSGSFVKGGPIYVQSSSVARTDLEGGYLSGAAPAVSDSYVRVLGYGTDTANVIYFNPDSTYVELA
jgi:hypothetical protein